MPDTTSSSSGHDLLLTRLAELLPDRWAPTRSTDAPMDRPGG
jgi:hypothetical protein